MPGRWAPVILDAFAVTILLVLFYDASRKPRKFLLPDQLLFIWMLIGNIVVLVLDSGTMLLEGQQFPGARTLNLTVTTLFYILNPVLSFLYICYADIKLNVAPEVRARRIPIYAAPIVINFFFALVSPWLSLFFHITPENTYARGSLLALSFAFSYCLLVAVVIRVAVIAYKEKRDSRPSLPYPGRRVITSLLLFPLPPLLGGLVQIWFYQVTVVWISTVFSLLIIFINVQNAQIITDELTGLYNRRHADSYLMRLLHRTKPFSLVMMDVNNMKQINDGYGHMAGDDALKTIAEVFHAQCRSDDFLSRYGGDEFVILTNLGGEQIPELIGRINRALYEIGAARKLPYRISVSAGAAAWGDGCLSADELFAAADAELYRQKASFRSESEQAAI